MHNIKFTKNQFATLLKLVYVGNWVINANRNDSLEEYTKIERYLFSQAPLFNLKDFSDSGDPSFPCHAFELGEIREFIDSYNLEAFWDELIEIIARKQMAKRYTETQLAKMTKIERVTLLFEIEDELKLNLSEKGIDFILKIPK